MAIFDADRLREGFKRANSQLTSAQKGLLGAVFVAVAAGVLLVTRFTGQDEYSVLYADLDSADAAQVVDALDARGIPFELADGGRTVTVPREQLYAARLDLSAEGLPAGGSPGWAILDEQGITTSDFKQRVGFQRALEGELARTISAIDGIRSADVHLVIPRDDVFVRDSVDSSASVLIDTTDAAFIDSSHVQAIVHLVSSAVEGLAPEDVTVADSQGQVLAAPGQQLSGAGLDGSLRATVAFEDDLSREIEQLLVPVVGAGNAVVTVNADLDYDEVSTTTEEWSEPVDGTDPAILTDSRRSEEYRGVASNPAVGVLGTESEVDETGEPDEGDETGDGTAASDDSPLTYRLDENQTEYAIDRVVTTVERAPGAIRSLSVAVVVEEGSITAEQLPEVESLVGAAAGLDPTRGDSLAVSRLAFDDAVVELAAPDDEVATGGGMDLVAMIRTGGVAVVVLLVIFLTWSSLRKARVPREAIGSIDLRALEAGGSPDGETEAVGAALAGVQTAALTGPTDPLADMSELIDRQPEEVAHLLRSWLGDRRGQRR